MADDATPYGEDFYVRRARGVENSAVRMVGALATVWRPGSVVDVGCGRGAWLKAWETYGARRLVGFDGAWNAQADMVSDRIEFRSADLNEPIASSERFDLAMSLEVAEHCRPEASDTVVSSLVQLSDAVLFGAAFSDQPGVDHINTRPHSFWCEKFIALGFSVFDYFRPRFWGDAEVQPWYQQNTFLYCRPHSPLFSALMLAGERPMPNVRFVDAVHPWLYSAVRS